MRILCALFSVATLAPPAAAGDIPDVLIVLETSPVTPGSVPEGAPPRFVLMKDGRVFVGGTALVVSGRLERGELSDLRKQAAAARKAVGRAGKASFGGDVSKAVRLRLPEDGPTDVTFDPADLAPALLPLRTLAEGLLRFDHPTLVPYTPERFLLSAREGHLPGGCRPWSFAAAVQQVAATSVVVGAAEASGWPHGGMPASVCVGEARYVVTLRPLLPGEQP